MRLNKTRKVIFIVTVIVVILVLISILAFAANRFQPEQEPSEQGAGETAAVPGEGSEQTTLPPDADLDTDVGASGESDETEPEQDASSGDNEPENTGGAQGEDDQGEDDQGEDDQGEKGPSDPEEDLTGSDSTSNEENPQQAEDDFAVPLSEAVENSWFSDAVFIGDSRTEGLMLYSGLTEATFLTSVGLMVDTAFTDPVIPTANGNVSVMDALATLEFSKVYIMLGVNELGWINLSVFSEDYGKIIDRVLEINPGAQVYVQAVMPVSAEKSSEDPIYNNENIARFNELIREVARDRQVFYIDTVEAVADESGALPSEATFDGVHLNPDYCVKWLDYLKTHTVSPEETSAQSEKLPVQEETT